MREDWILMIEKVWLATQLDQACFRHGLFDDQIKNLTHRDTGGPVLIFNVSSVDLELAFLVDYEYNFLSEN